MKNKSGTFKLSLVLSLIVSALFQISPASSATLSSITFTPIAGTTGTVSTILANTPNGAVTAIVVPAATNSATPFVPTVNGRVASFTYNAQFSGSYIVYYVYNYFSGPTLIQTTDNGTFTRNAIVALNSITPGSGIVPLGGLVAQIQGTGLTGTNLVTIGNIPANILGVTDTIVTISIPASVSSGENTVYVYVNSNRINTTLKFVKQAPPTISRISPSSAPSGVATNVTISGTGLTGTSVVLFGNTPASNFTVTSDSQIVAVTPTNIAKGTNQVTLIHPLGNITQRFDFFGNLSITSVSPNSGDLLGGNSVVLVGSGFQDITAVRFGSIPAKSFTINSDTTITAVAPAGVSAGITPISLSTLQTSATTNYTYIAVPRITAIIPSQGMENRRIKVRIVGTNLGSVRSITFNGILGKLYREKENNFYSYSAYVPSNMAPGVVNVVVTTSNGVATSTFTIIGKPRLTSANLTVPQMVANARVILTGVNLTGATKVVVNGLPGKDLQVLSPTQVAITLPKTAYHFAFFRVYVGSSSSNLFSVYE